MEGAKHSEVALGIVLRVPGVLMIEMLYMQSISLKRIPAFSSGFADSALNFDILLYLIAWSLVLLPLKVLFKIYVHTIAGLCIAGSHYILYHLLVSRKLFPKDAIFDSYLEVNTSVENSPWTEVACNQAAMDNCVSVFLFQMLLALISCWMIKSKGSNLLLFLLPLVPWMTGRHSSTTLIKILQLCHFLSVATVIIYLTTMMDKVVVQFKLMVLKVKLVISLFGWHGIVTWAQEEYKVQYLLVTCWMLRYAVQLYSNLHHGNSLENLHNSLFDMLNMRSTDISNFTSMVFVAFFTGVQCLTTTVNLFGLACIVKDVVRLQYFLIR